MNRILALLVTALALLAPPTWAQGLMKAGGKLYTRVQGSELELTIQIRIDPGFHLYHKELGAPDSVGKPLTVELAGEGVTFDALWWPEPHRFEQKGLGDGGRDTFILGHDTKLVLYGHGRLADGVSDPEVTAKLDGLTCEDGGSCFPYFETLESRGEGRDKYWEDYPADFWSGGAAATPAADHAGTGDAPARTDEPQEGGDHLSGELYARRDGDRVRLALALEVPFGEHLGHTDKGNPDGIAMDSTLELRGAGVAWDEVAWPAPVKHVPSWGSENDWVFVHHGDVVVRAEGVIDGAFELDSLAARLEGQVCEDDGACYLVKLTFPYAGAGPDALFDASGAAGGTGQAGADAPPANGEAKPAKKKDEGLLALILAAISGGIFALLMPCTYPMIPITISFFTKQAEARHGSVLPLSLLYGTGIVLIFVVIGLVVGPPIMKFATHPVTNLVMGSMFVFFAAVLFGALTLNPPQFLMRAAGKASMKGGLAGVFLMGMTLVLTSFTCTAPFVGSLLSVASQSSGEGASWLDRMLHIGLGMAVFGTTMAVPFVILSLIPGKLKAMPSSGEWMDTLKISLGFVELAAALKFFSNVDLVWGWNTISREMFLLMWAAIFVCAAAYLFGFIRLRGHATAEIGAGRMLGATAFLLMGLYCWHGYNGHKLDPIMTAIIPNYSSSLGGASTASAAGGGGGVGHMGLHTIVKDDFEEAKRLALAEGKPVLLNFTGFV
ncbi:MAG: hypothetical protein H6828_05150 [Planctomycetes bacterium]|nr:hypothetical protein [Planctomycetota bacterium]